MWWPKPARAQVDLAQTVEEEKARAFTTGCSNSRSTKARGESALVSSSSRPSGLRSSRARRPFRGQAGACGSRARGSARRWAGSPRASERRVAASFALKRPNEAAVFSKSVHHSRASPLLRTRATFSSGSRYSALVALELEVRVPGGLADGPMEERMDVVEEAREAAGLRRWRDRLRPRRAARGRAPEAGPAQVGLQDQAVVARAEEDPVVLGAHRGGADRPR